VPARLLRDGIAVGVPLGQYYTDLDGCLVVTVTEKRTKDEILALARKLEGAL
jgi:glycine dehydrogenase subunit 1